jgi:hypothetical protein
MGLGQRPSSGVWSAFRGASRLVTHLWVEEKSMKTILIAHRDVAFAEQLASQLRTGGYSVISRPGPCPSVERCVRCDASYCALTDGVDLMMYDPLLTALNAQGDRYNVAVNAAHDRRRLECPSESPARA